MSKFHNIPGTTVQPSTQWCLCQLNSRGCPWLSLLASIVVCINITLWCSYCLGYWLFVPLIAGWWGFPWSIFLQRRLKLCKGCEEWEGEGHLWLHVHVDTRWRVVGQRTAPRWGGAIGWGEDLLADISDRCECLTVAEPVLLCDDILMLASYHGVNWQAYLNHACLFLFNAHHVLYVVMC